MLFLIKWLVVIHETDVFFHLLQAACTRQYHEHTIDSCYITQCPRNWRFIRIILFQLFLCFFRKICQESAFQWFHNNYWQTILMSNFNTFSGFHTIIFPIKVIDLQLDKFHFRMFLQYIVQEFCICMSGKT